MKIEILLNLLITLFISILTFIINKYFAKYMGIEDLGLMKLFTQMVAYLSIAELGLGTASAYALYKPLAEKNIKQISIVVSTIGDLYKKISIVILIVGLILNPIIPFFIKDKNLSKMLYIYWSLYVLNTSLSYIYAKYNILFIANQKFMYTRIVQGVTKIFVQFLQIYVIFKFQSFIGFIILLISENLIQFLLYKNHYKKKYTYILKVKEKEKNISKDLMNLFWHKISGLIVFNTDFIIIAKYISLNFVGVYSSYQMVVNMLITLISIITNVLTPKIGNYIANNNQKKIFNLWKKINIIFVFIGLNLTYITYKVINPFIELWLGKDFILPKLTVILIMINLFIQSTRIIVEIFKNGCGFFNDIHLPLIESSLNLISSLILVKYFNINGVIFGTIISNVLIIVLIKPMLVFKKCFNESYIKYIEILVKYLGLVFLVVLINEVIFFKIIVLNELNSWFKWIIESIKVGIICVTCSLLIFSLDKEFRKNLKFLKK
ncbi:lipopolysaccharide biosynthesis protein [Cetobacterium sp.]|uniref:lipopolysaccharide biosynthesis protein n=1 Tax=Cetobacterium sp. TaxID=2071632 RepID=UPI003EE6F802